MKSYAICDCDNFFASCERVFAPSLHDKPVVILSNNDGCIIARSSEAKALGIAMGTPLYQIKDFLEKNDVAVFSSNYTLYGDMSRRVMSLLSKYSPVFWQYSIDEMFLDLTGIASGNDLLSYCKSLRKTVTQGTGIPITIGIAPTKTLAKAASKFGKKYKGFKGVCMIDDETKRIKALKMLNVSDVWGIGRRTNKKLDYFGIKTAWDFTQKSEKWIQKEFTVTGLKTWKELQGVDCINVDELPEKKSICTSRSFADQGLADLSQIEEALTNFTAECSRKLRSQHSCCKMLTVFAYTSRFRDDVPQASIYKTIELPVPSNDRQELTGYVMKTLRAEWKAGTYLYKKAGIIVWEMTPDNAIQSDLLDTVDRDKQAALAKTIDAINLKNGQDAVHLAIQGHDKSWFLKCEHKSKQFTTNLKDIIHVK
ncbi:MAG: Y-family DNA polymerase [Bacteroidales bacterium]|nr:Y-family DNA polymerase [Bacteroidales bacterium]